MLMPATNITDISIPKCIALYTSKVEIKAFIVPTLSMNRKLVDDYWQALIDAGTIDARLCDVDNPNLDTVHRMTADPMVLSFAIYDTIFNRIVAEFALENFTGRAAQIHFSTHPKNKPLYSLQLGRWAADQVLNHWSNDDKPYVDTLYGLTPVTNKAACIFVKRVGFKFIGYLRKGIKDRGKIVDAMIIQMERDNGR